MLTISKTAVPLGSFRGQRSLIVNYLNLIDGSVPLPKLVEDLTPTYLPVINLWAIEKAGGVEGSIRYHLKTLAKLGQVKLEGALEAKPRAAFKGSIAPQKGLASEDVQMDDDVLEMARRSYGYGRWAARFWFIGPEQGQALDENNDLKPRAEAWRHFGGRELDDCCEFHARIDEQRWHRVRPALQPTWRPFILLLMAFLGRPTDRESLRRYQRDEWGTLSGETCVIELSGQAAHSFAIPRNRRLFREERIEVIRERMLLYKPTLVVMYGMGEKPHWEEITKQRFPPGNILTLGPTIVALAPFPRGLTNDYWRKLGERLRGLSNPNALRSLISA